MAYNEFLGERISNSLRKRGVQFEEKRMFGGMAFMVEPASIDLDEDLDAWIGLALEYNPRAKTSKKKR
jgi:hypothetical protein